MTMMMTERSGRSRRRAEMMADDVGETLAAEIREPKVKAEEENQVDMIANELEGAQALGIEVEGLLESLNEPPSDEAEHLREKMEKMQTLRMKAKEEMQSLRESRITAREALQDEVMASKQVNVQLNQQLEIRQNFCRHLQGIMSRLYSTIKSQTKTIECVSKDKNALAGDLQAEHACRLQLSAELQEHKDALAQKCRRTEALSRENEVLASELQEKHAWTLQLSNELRQYKDTLLQIFETSNSTAEAEAERIASLSKEMESLTAELQHERTWKLRLTNELQEYKSTLLQKSQADNKSTVVEAEGSQRVSAQLSARLKTETTKIESWCKEKESLTIEPQRDSTWRLQLSNELQEYKENSFHAESSTIEAEAPHQMLESLQSNFTRQRSKEAGEVTETQSETIKNLKISNFLLNHQLTTQKGVRENLETEVSRLSERLETEVKNKYQLSKLRESDASELQLEKNLRAQLKNELEKEKSARREELAAVRHSRDETQALHRKLDDLEAANAELCGKLKTEQDLCDHFHVITVRLSDDLQAERGKSRFLTDALLKEEASNKQQSSNAYQELVALESMKEATLENQGKKKGRSVFGWRKKNKQKQEESSLPTEGEASAEQA